jgi:carbon storage regulator
LVLTRRAGESIVIGDDVRVVVLDVRGDTVRLGIEAPRSVQVHRAEVYAEVQAANAAANAAAGTAAADLTTVADRLQRIARPRPPRSQRPQAARGPGAARGPAPGPTPGPVPGPPRSGSPASPTPSGQGDTPAAADDAPPPGEG